MNSQVDQWVDAFEPRALLLGRACSLKELALVAAGTAAAWQRLGSLKVNHNSMVGETKWRSAKASEIAPTRSEASLDLTT